MKLKFIFISLIIFCSSFQVKNKPFFTSSNIKTDVVRPFTYGEKLSYKIAYGVIEAGKAKLEVSSIAKYPECYRVVGRGYTNFAFDWFFKVRDHYESIIDSNEMKPLLFIRKVQEGSTEFEQYYSFNHESQTVNTGNKVINIPENIQDMVSSYFYARTLNLNNSKRDTILSFNSIVDEEIYDLRVKFLGKEKIKISAGEFNALKFCPIVQQGRIFKAEEDLTVWISDDYNKIPLLAKAKIWVGSIRMELEKMEGELNKPNLLE